MCVYVFVCVCVLTVNSEIKLMFTYKHSTAMLQKVVNNTSLILAAALMRIQCVKWCYWLTWHMDTSVTMTAKLRHYFPSFRQSISKVFQSNVKFIIYFLGRNTFGLCAVSVKKKRKKIKVVVQSFGFYFKLRKSIVSLQNGCSNR